MPNNTTNPNSKSSRPRPIALPTPPWPASSGDCKKLTRNCGARSSIRATQCSTPTGWLGTRWGSRPILMPISAVCC